MEKNKMEYLKKKDTIYTEYEFEEDFDMIVYQKIKNLEKKLKNEK